MKSEHSSTPGSGCNCPFKSPGKRLMILIAASALLLSVNVYIVMSGAGREFLSAFH